MLKLATFASLIDETKTKKYENSIGLSKVVRYIIDATMRSNNRRQYDNSKTKYKNTVRRDAADDHADLVEKELKALSRKDSALNDRPYVQKQGKHDFLVMQPRIVDGFVTVVPNQVYYDIEKPCVNWLDECSLIGLRQRLLRGSRF